MIARGRCAIGSGRVRASVDVGWVPKGTHAQQLLGLRLVRRARLTEPPISKMRGSSKDHEERVAMVREFSYSYAFCRFQGWGMRLVKQVRR